MKSIARITEELNLMTTVSAVGKKGFELTMLTIFCKPELFDKVIQFAVKYNAPFEKQPNGINLFFEA